MRKACFTKSMLFLFALSHFAGSGNLYSKSHVWLAVDVPSPKPELGTKFVTNILVSSWNGAPGALDFTIEHDPQVLRMLSITLDEDSPFFENCFVDSSQSENGLTRFVCFQSNNDISWEKLYRIGHFNWQVLAVKDSTTDISLGAQDVVEIDRSPVEFFTFGQRIRFYSPDMPDIPTSYKLDHNYPNPFNNTTMIPYRIIEKQHVSIQIFNVLGQLVYTLVDERQDRGNYLAEWNGENNFGNQVATGVYFYQMKAGPFTEAKKLLLVR